MTHSSSAASNLAGNPANTFLQRGVAAVRVFMLLAVLLATAGPAGANPFDWLLHAGNKKVQAGDLPGALKDFSNAIGIDPNHAIAHLSRGGVWHKMGKPENALKDYSKAIELDDDLAEAFASRGALRFGLADYANAELDYSAAITRFARSYKAFSGMRLDELLVARAVVRLRLEQRDEAMADLSQAITLKPKLPLAYRTRGMLLVGRGEHAASLPDLAKAEELGERGYVQLIRYVAARRSGAPDYDLAKAMKGWRLQSAWLRVLGKFMLGEISEAKLLAQAHAEKEPTGARCEAHYYAGIKRLLAGDKAGASAQFKLCVATGQTTFTEYRAATAELAALEPASP